MRVTLILVCGLLSLPAPMAAASNITCFVPGANCAALVASEIESGAQREVLVQAYGFTNAVIFQALGRAKERGVNVRVILDKSNETSRYSGAAYLADHGIAPLIDYRVRIAHNKVVIIDGKTVITGSFNFTAAAQQHNAENVLIVRDDQTATSYRTNWLAREAVSRPWRDFRTAAPADAPQPQAPPTPQPPRCEVNAPEGKTALCCDGS